MPKRKIYRLEIEHDIVLKRVPLIITIPASSEEEAVIEGTSLLSIEPFSQLIKRTLGSTYNSSYFKRRVSVENVCTKRVEIKQRRLTLTITQENLLRHLIKYHGTIFYRPWGISIEYLDDCRPTFSSTPYKVSSSTVSSLFWKGLLTPVATLGLTEKEIATQKALGVLPELIEFTVNKERLKLFGSGQKVCLSRD